MGVGFEVDLIAAEESFLEASAYNSSKGTSVTSVVV
jgi:hypothetical protein